MKRAISILMATVMCISLGACGKKTDEKTEKNTEQGVNQKTQENKEDSGEKYIYDEKYVNNETFYVAGDSIYQTSSLGLWEVNAETMSRTRIDDCYFGVAVTNDAIYYINRPDSALVLNEFSNDSDKPKQLYEVAEGVAYFMDDDYIYTVSKNGSVIKNVHSASEYEESAEVIYRGLEYNIKNVKFYNNNVYYMSDDDLGTVIEISIKDGSSKELTLPDWKSYYKYYFYKENIIYRVQDVGIYKVDINTADVVKYDKYENITGPMNGISIVDGCVYVCYVDKKSNVQFDRTAIRIDLSKEGDDAYSVVEDADLSEVVCGGSKIEDSSTGIIYNDSWNNTFYMFDYDGNRIS